MTMNRNLGYFQIGKETVHGTLVPATERILVEDDLAFTDDDNIVWRPNLRRGTLGRHPGNEVVTKRGVRWSMPDTPIELEQMQRFLGMSIQGGVVSTVVVPAPAGRHSWAYERSLTALQDIDTYSLERRASDGTNNKDLRVPYCFATKLTFKGTIDGPVTVAIEGVGRAPAAGPVTPALTNPAVGIPVSFQSAMYIDNSWATLGGTLVSGVMIGWQLEITPGWMPYSTMQGQQTLDFGTHILNPDNVGVDFRASCFVGNQYDTERTAARAVSDRFVRLAMTLDPTTDGRSLNIDMALKHNAADILAFTVTEGQLVAEFRMVDSADNGAHLLAATLINRATT